MANFVQLAFNPIDLVGTEVAYDVTKDDWLIGHYVTCKSIVPLQNCQDYLVNGNLLMPHHVLLKHLELLASNAKAKAADGRPEATTWMPTPVDKPSLWAILKATFTRKAKT